MMALVLAEHDRGELKPATLHAVTAACAIGGAVHVIVAGYGCEAAAEQAAAITGIDKVLWAEGPELAEQQAEPLAKLLAPLANTYSAFVAAATSTAKNVMPRLAAMLDVMQVSDVCRILAPDTFVRPIYAGDALQTVRTRDAIAVMTIRAAKFRAAERGGSAPIERMTVPAGVAKARVTGEMRSISDRPELTSARIVVSGGRALGSAAKFGEVILPLANKLGAAVGASRAAVDAGFAPSDSQVGQTGKVVAPDLYVAVGISGAIQHLAGMKDAKVIVAINKDEDAPIFQVADYGLVGDLFELVPQLNEALQQKQ